MPFLILFLLGFLINAALLAVRVATAVVSLALGIALLMWLTGWLHLNLGLTTIRNLDGSYTISRAALSSPDTTPILTNPDH